ncbi:helix-turn-helix domain-containing protein [Flavobacterium sp.]|uniref:helix-turn-helix domain-containing protein n=1 Tax=Flavobacterium sp. TaxID=239 RepID=UPI0037531943
MSIQNIPESLIFDASIPSDLFIYDLKMTQDVINSKVNLGLNMFSFLQIGHKKVHFADTSVAVNENQSVLIKNGNCLMTELIGKDKEYYCKLFFFSSKKVRQFLDTNNYKRGSEYNEKPYFIIENDSFITDYISSLSSKLHSKNKEQQDFLQLKFEEIIHYLIHKYNQKFIDFLLQLISEYDKSPFKNKIETNSNLNLKVEQLAFLFNMSISTFKRTFENEYAISPGKWFQEKRLLKAKRLLENGTMKCIDVHLECGYESASNFSNAYKKRFGKSPKKDIKIGSLSN